MCGVFGFISHNGKTTFKLESLEQIALVTETRGHHAFGLAWINERGVLKCFKQKGRISDHLSVLAMAQDAVMLIGHTRYTTQGTEDHNINNHPHHADGGWIVHNGIVRNYESLLDTHPMLTSSDCDSETIARLFEDEDGTRTERLKNAVDQVESSALAVLGLWNHRPELVAIRRGNPLHWSKTPRGIYLASLAKGHPRAAHQIPDGTATTFRFKNGECHVHSSPLANYENVNG
jgi:glucosamine 6-phosphate synthetase-like amidotransferase/phosphosugar isomerase protein